MSGPLAHLTVLDLSRVLAGPWCTQILADLGATVIKIERPGGGDDTRAWGPPYLKDAQGHDTTEAAYYLACNRGKLSVAVDFTTADGQAIVRDLARQASVLVENYKVGGLEKYGLDYASVSALNPRLVYASITGFGQNGPYADRAGYDFIIQGMSGFMSVTGERDDLPGGGPQKAGIAITDLMTGMYTTVAIQAALAHCDRTGQGQWIDTCLFDSAVAMMAVMNMNYLVTGRAPGRAGNAHQNIVPYQVFACSDGHVILAVGNDSQFAKFCEVAGRAEWAQDPRYAKNAERVRNRAVLVPLIAEVMAVRTQRQWLEALEPLGVPCGPINRLDQVFSDPQLAARGLRRDLPHALAGVVPQVGTPIRLSVTSAECEHPPPLLGEHTAAVLARATRVRRCHDRRARGARRDRSAALIPDAATATTDPERAGTPARSAFWLAFATLAALALVIAWRFFPLAIPLVNLDITLSRSEALTKADEIAARLALAPSEARSAVAFRARQRDAELRRARRRRPRGVRRAGQGRLYAPYWWEVRIFRPGEVNEVTIRFRPDGASNGFGRRVAETYVRDAATKALPRRRRALSPRSARLRTGRSISSRTRCSSSRSRRVPTGGSTTRSSTSAPTRWARRTSGCGSPSPVTSSPASRRTCTCPSRSTADSASCAARTTRSPAWPAYPRDCSTVSADASSACCGSRASIGCSVRPALAAGFVVGGLMAATTLSAAPTAWFDFDTAQSVTTFWLRQVGAVAAVAIGGGMAYALVFMAAESLTRRAFPPSAAVVARLVRGRRRVARGARTHARRLRLRADRARAHRRVLLRDQPLARLVATVRGR